MLQTEYAFTLPKGYIDKDGNLHRQGVMRLANAKDEIAPLQDPRVQRNPDRPRQQVLPLGQSIRGTKP